MGYDTQYNPATGSYDGGNNPMSTDSAYQANNMIPGAPSGGVNPMNALIQQLLTQQPWGGGQPGYPQQQYSQQPQGGSLGGDLLGMGLKMGMKKFGPQIAGGIGNFLGMGGAATTGAAGGGALAALGPLALAAGGVKLGGEAIDKLMPGYRKGLNKATTGMFGKKAKNMLAPWKWRL